MPSRRARVAQVWRRPWSFSLGSGAGCVDRVANSEQSMARMGTSLKAYRGAVEPRITRGVSLRKRLETCW
jgi:hypothetical protein